VRAHFIGDPRVDRLSLHADHSSTLTPSSSSVGGESSVSTRTYSSQVTDEDTDEDTQARRAPSSSPLLKAPAPKSVSIDYTPSMQTLHSMLSSRLAVIGQAFDKNNELVSDLIKFKSRG